MKSLWVYALRNLKRSPRRTIASVLTLVFGYAGLVLLGGYILRMQGYLEVNSVYLNHAGHVGIYKKEGIDRGFSDPKRFALDADTQTKILGVLNADPRVEFTAPVLRGMGLASDGCRSAPFIATGFDPEAEARIRSAPAVLKTLPELVRLQSGRGFWEKGAHPRAISITSSLGELIHKRSPSAEPFIPVDHPSMDCANTDYLKSLEKEPIVQLVANAWNGDFSAGEGILEGFHTTGLAFTEDTDLIAPLNLMQKLYATDAITYFAVYLKNPADLRNFKADLRARLGALNLDLDVLPFDDDRVSLFYVGAMNFLYVMAGFFIFLVCGVVTLSVVNTLGMMVIERQSELGTLRAIGFSQGTVASIFAREAFITALVSAFVGAILSFAIAGMVNAAGIRFTIPGLSGDLQFKLEPNLLLALGASLLLMVLASLVSYLVAYKLLGRQITDLLHGVTA